MPTATEMINHVSERTSSNSVAHRHPPDWEEGPLQRLEELLNGIERQRKSSPSKQEFGNVWFDSAYRN